MALFASVANLPGAKPSTLGAKAWVAVEVLKSTPSFYDIAGGAWPSLLRDEGGFRKPLREPAKR